jgi:hypothetical protein
MENELTEQPQGDSVESRIASSLFGEQPNAQQPSEQTQSEEAPETFEFEYGGAKHILPKALEKAVMQERDYTQKSQQVSERAKDFDRQFAQVKLHQQAVQFEQSIQEERRTLSVLDAVLQDFQNKNWQAMEVQDLIKTRIEMEGFQERKKALEAQIAQKRGQFEHSVRAELEKIKAEASESIKRRIQGWSETHDAEIKAYALDKGITAEEMDGVLDPRHKEILWEAAQFRKLKDSAQPAAQQLKAVKTGSTTPMPQDVKDKLNFGRELKKVGSQSGDGQKLITARLGSMFRR